MTMKVLPAIMFLDEIGEAPPEVLAHFMRLANGLPLPASKEVPAEVFVPPPCACCGDEFTKYEPFITLQQENRAPRIVCTYCIEKMYLERSS